MSRHTALELEKSAAAASVQDIRSQLSKSIFNGSKKPPANAADVESLVASSRGGK